MQALREDEARVYRNPVELNNRWPEGRIYYEIANVFSKNYITELENCLQAIHVEETYTHI